MKSVAKKSRWRLLAVLLGFAVLATACAEDEPAEEATATTAAPTEETTEAEPEPEEEPEAEPAETEEEVDEEPEEEPAAAEISDLDQWAVDYVGGEPGVASGEPIKIGFASTNDFFPGALGAAQEGVTYVNEVLGGVDGRPLELEVCNIAGPEDGAACGAEFANNDELTAVVGGSIFFPSTDFYAAVAGTHPIYASTPLTTDQYVDPNAPSYSNGALGAGLGLGFFAAGLGPSNVAVVATDDDTGRGAFDLLAGVLGGAGIGVTPVFVPTTATAPEIEAALTAVDGANAEVLVIGLFGPGCVSAYDALNSLGIDATDDAGPTVLTTGACWDRAVTQYLETVGDSNQVPNGWYYSWFGYNPFMENNEVGLVTYMNRMEEVGQADIAIDTGAPQAFASMVTLAKHMNALDGDYSLEAIDNAIRSFEGPAMIYAGPQRCGASPVFLGVCSSRVGVHRYLNGEWQPIAEGDNAVDISAGLFIAG